VVKQFNRRLFVLASIGAGSGITIGAAAKQIEPAIVPEGTPSATPAASLPLYKGPLSDIWDAPWNIEDALVAFDAVILQRDTAPSGKVIAVGKDGLFTRSLLHVAIPELRGQEVFIATNEDIEVIAEQRTGHFVGAFGGQHGPGWTIPVIIATSVSLAIEAPTPAATPPATPTA